MTVAQYILSSIALILWPLTVSAQHFVVTSDVWEPFFIENDDGHSGIGIEILDEIFAITGDTYSVVTLPMRRAERLFEDGKVDLIVIDSPQWNDPKKADIFLFSQPIMHIKEHIYFHNDRFIDVTNPSDMDGKTVSIRAGYRYPVFDAAFAQQKVLKHEVNSDLTLLRLLKSKRTDAIFLDTAAFAYALKDSGINPSLFVRGMELSHAELGVKFTTSNRSVLPRVNAAIRQLKDRGTIEEIFQRYMK